MKLSFNKKPITDYNQLNLFGTKFKQGDAVKWEDKITNELIYGIITYASSDGSRYSVKSTKNFDKSINSEILHPAFFKKIEHADDINVTDSLAVQTRYGEVILKVTSKIADTISCSNASGNFSYSLEYLFSNFKIFVFI